MYARKAIRAEEAREALVNLQNIIVPPREMSIPVTKEYAEVFEESMNPADETVAFENDPPGLTGLDLLAWRNEHRK